MAHQEVHRPRGRGRTPAVQPSANAAPPRKTRRLRVPRWVWWTFGALILALAGLSGYTGLRVRQFQNQIYKPLPPTPAQAPALTLRIASPTSLVADPTLPPATATPPGASPTVPATQPLLAVASPTPVAAALTETPRPPVATTPAPVPPLPTTPATVAASVGRFNILVLGTDKRTDMQDVAARSDTMILLSVDPQWKTAGVLSIPRDLQVTIPGYGLQKINAAYFYGEYDQLPGGGPALALQTVSSYFNVPIPYYVAINFDGFQKVIDSMGGIGIYVPAAIDDPLYPGPGYSYIHVHFDPGCQHMDGARALEYARTRHADSDFGRSQRQQQVIKAMRERVLQVNMLPRFGDLLNQLGDTVATNIPPDQQWMFLQLGSQIPTNALYTAQIDGGMVREVGTAGNLDLQWDKAAPLLDWFLGRGSYTDLKPGSVPAPGSTATPLGPARTATTAPPDKCP